MKGLERKKFELHAKQAGYARRVEEAERHIRATFEKYDTPYVSVSGGKDSTVLHHLVTQRCGYDDVDVFHFDQGKLAVPGAREHVETLIEEFGGTDCVRTSKAMYDESMSQEERHSELHAGRHGWIRKLTEERDWDVAMLGIRAEESARRRDRYTGSPPTHVMSGRQVTVAPVHELTTEDVWAYIVENELPYHEQYDKKGKLLGSIDARENRLSSFQSPGLDRFGEGAVSSFLYPSESNKVDE